MIFGETGSPVNDKLSSLLKNACGIMNPCEIPIPVYDGYRQRLGASLGKLDQLASSNVQDISVPLVPVLC